MLAWHNGNTILLTSLKFSPPIGKKPTFGKERNRTTKMTDMRVLLKDNSLRTVAILLKGKALRTGARLEFFIFREFGFL